MDSHLLQLLHHILLLREVQNADSWHLLMDQIKAARKVTSPAAHPQLERE